MTKKSAGSKPSSRDSRDARLAIEPVVTSDTLKTPETSVKTGRPRPLQTPVMETGVRQKCELPTGVLPSSVPRVAVVAVVPPRATLSI